jgi:hypothetical protein
MLMAVMVMPAMAEVEQQATASVSVDEFISITLSDEGTSGINFGSVDPDGSTYGDLDQSDGTPAIEVVVGGETNVSVDIGIKGETAGALALTNWKYSETFGGAKTSLPAAYAAVYTAEGVGSYDFYHWVTVPNATASGTYNATVYYKAVKTGTSF